MKNFVLFTCCFLMIGFFNLSKAQDNMEGSLGLPGDNLNLYAVMKLFQESRTLELFEKNLNDQNSRINNLDLNGDGQIDYLSVIDNFDGKEHTIVLRDAINANESQDVAVFYVGKDANNRVQIQLVGDEALYGKNYILEPNSGVNTNGGQTLNPGYSGNTNVIVEEPAEMEVNAWPLLSLLFLPSYVVWHSPYYYGYYPSYWRPWQPLYWHAYYGYQSNMNPYYMGSFRRSYNYHDAQFHERYYAGRRNYAPSVIQRRDEGFYRNTYSHPELRREGYNQFKSLHPENSNRPGNRAGVQQRNGYPQSRQGENRAVNNPRNSRATNRPATTGYSRPAATQPNRPAARSATSEGRPSVNQGNTRRYTRPPNNTGQIRPGGNRVQQRNQQVRPAASKQPAAKQAVKPNRQAPRNENKER